MKLWKKADSPKAPLVPMVETPKVGLVQKPVEEEPVQIRLPMKGEEQYLSVAEVAKLLQVEKPTVYRYIYAQKLKDIVIGGKRRIAKSELERFANSYNQGERLRTVRK